MERKTIVAVFLPKTSCNSFPKSDERCIYNEYFTFPTEKSVFEGTDIVITVASSPVRCCDFLEKAPNVKLVISPMAGIEHIVLARKTVKNMPPVCRIKDHISHPMTEYFFHQLFLLERKINIKGAKNLWPLKDNMANVYSIKLLNGSSIAFLGFGTIGKKIARVCKAFGMTVWAINTSGQVKEDYVDYARTVKDLDEVLGNCEYVCNVLPVTKDTTDILSGETLKACQNRNTVFINIGRGNVISDEAILTALRNKWIRAAILDVFRTEPLPQDHPFYKEENIIITPHVSWYHDNLFIETSKQCIDLIHNFLDGKSIPFLPEDATY
ncbi:DgyrCDS13037 [Dimorphilus gyrociliatus]|uniref:DgyrCDS13037 n=1 Tax=Dimorphilus gyrociliatus TaxID=2664684 RepID=A0A7I8W9J2_9ANNE|nr:DgyrCDS13037 [Dimorphilus gyrociliatus]